MNSNDKEYKKHKYKVKLWERNFRERENRAPSKEDIKAAPNDIREAYKLYWLAKTSILEDEILEDEAVATEPQLPQREEKNSEVIESNSLPKANFNKDSVWGEHLTNAVVKKKGTTRNPNSLNFTEKLFKGVKLKMNKRTFGLRKLKPNLPVVEPTPLKTCQDIPSHDAAPISSEEKEVKDDVDLEKGQLLTESCFERVKVVENEVKVPVEPVSILDNLINSRGPSFRSKLNEGWLERCHKKCIEDTTAVQLKENRRLDPIKPRLWDEKSDPNDSNVKPKAIIEVASKTDECQNTGLSSDDDYVYGSDDETVSTLKSKSASMGQIISKSKTGRKRSAEEVSRPSKKPKLRSNVEETQERKLDRLQEKLDKGTASDNFVKIDIKHRRYARGKKTMTSTKYKIQQWKAKKKMSKSSRTNSNVSGVVLKCFRCGETGHFMNVCKKNDALLPLEKEIEEDDSPFPTLEDAEAMVKEKENNDAIHELETILESSLTEEDDLLNSVPPIYECEKDGTLIDTPDEVFEALHELGFQNFRTGQERAIMRILSGKSTLVVAGTGSGKSLCYLLPAYLYALKHKCISIVISPLVALMEDQVLNFPPCLKAACLHSNQTEPVRKKILEKLQNCEIAVLLMSPEAMISGERGILGQSLKNFPKIAFVCIDEVHCVSQWSHNFRTSYLMICKILRERYNIKTMLGLTATATKTSLASITQHLGVNDESGVLQKDIFPDNLILSVSKDESKDAALIGLLKEPPFSEFDSIIIYCLRRNECEQLASFLRTSLQSTKKKLSMFGERSTISRDVEVYHAGISAGKRKKIQNHFMQGKLRIVIATIAFGMGINKADIRGIIHYNMPRTFEDYVQEIGRAGRDGLLARCHLLYDHQGGDLPELKRHIYRNSLDRPTIRELLCKVFPRCSCEGICRKHEIAFPVEDTVNDLDLAQENISTLLCYLELLPEKIVEVLPPTYTKCRIVSYNGTLALKRAVKKNPILAIAIANYCHVTKTTTVPNRFEFSVIELADHIGWDCQRVKRELKRCEWTQVNSTYKKTGISVSFFDLGFHVRSSGNLSEEQQNQALESLYDRVNAQERVALHQLKICDQAFSSAAYDSIDDLSECVDLDERDSNLKKIIHSYFTEEIKQSDLEPAEINILDEGAIVNHIHQLVLNYRDISFNARVIARIFHGIESPNYPALVWGRTRYWRCCLHEDFNAVFKIARRDLRKYR